jgi:hypothetical protein
MVDKSEKVRENIDFMQECVYVMKGTLLMNEHEREQSRRREILQNYVESSLKANYQP